MPQIGSTVHTQEDDLELYVRGKLEPGHTNVVESHLTECPSCRENLRQCVGLELTVHPAGNTKAKERYERSEPRFSSGDEAILQELTPFSPNRQKIEIVDISKHGVGILATELIMPGTIVQIRIKNNTELGEVRYCSTFGTGYRLGVRLHPRF